jgi:hypothetical protein
MLNRLAFLIVLAGLCGFAGAAFADDANSLEGLVVEMADAPAEHAAVARFFRAKAEDARKEMRLHQGMGRSYGGGKLGTRIELKSHCDKLAEQYAAVAAEYEELAKLHEAQATAP